MTEVAAEDHGWEACKENVQPVKRGRSTNVLGEKLTTIRSSADTDAINAKHLNLFEDMLQQARDIHTAAVEAEEQGLPIPPTDSNQVPGLLEVYLLYFKWIRDTYPSSSEKALAVLERATCDLKHADALKNDARFIKLWIEYADMVRAPGDIFSFMQSNKIGEKVALFWIAWAFVAEKAENFKLTDQIFTKGLKRQAEPRDLLQKRYQQFQRRMARHLINTQEEEADRAAAAAAAPTSGGGGGGGGGTSARVSEERAALSHLSKSRGTGSTRTGSAISSKNGIGGGLGSQASQSNISNNSRRSSSTSMSIGAASRMASAASSASASASASARPASAVPQGLGNFQIFSDADTPAAPAAAPTSSSSSSSSSAFGIYCDDAPALAENPQWKELASQKAVVKENAGPVTTWSSGGLDSDSRASARLPSGARGGSAASISSSDSSVRAVAPPAAPSFSIFSDEVDPPPVQSSQAPGAAARHHVGIKEHVGAAHDPLAHLRRDRDIRAPLATAAVTVSAPKPAPVQVPAPVAPAAPVAEPAAASAVFPIFADEDGETAALAGMMSEMGALDDEDGTINTRLAMSAINSMFASPPAPAAKPVEKKENRAGAGSSGTATSSFGSRNTNPRNSSGAFPSGPGLRLGGAMGGSATVRTVGIGSRMTGSAFSVFSDMDSGSSTADIGDLSMIHDGNDHTNTAGFALDTPMGRPAARTGAATGGCVGGLSDTPFTIFHD